MSAKTAASFQLVKDRLITGSLKRVNVMGREEAKSETKKVTFKITR